VQLYIALAECGIGADDIPQVAERLVKPPISIGFSAAAPSADFELTTELSGEHEMLSLKEREADRDMDARMLRLNEGQPDPGVMWEALSRAERKRAKSLDDWTTKEHGLSVTPQGRPPGIDPTLVLYCSRVLCESAGELEFRFSRVSGVLSGPMWRALIEALPLAQLFLKRRSGQLTIARDSIKKPDHRKIHPESIAEIIRVARSEPFKNLSQQLGLGPAAGDIALNAAVCRIAIAYTSKSR
jgi:hypothetical protein